MSGISEQKQYVCANVLWMCMHTYTWGFPVYTLVRLGKIQKLD